MSLVELPTASLLNNPGNIRRNLGDLTELADSIRGIGILQPLTIAPAPDFFESKQYVVIAGNRRLAAAALAELPTVPCIIRPDLMDAQTQLEAQLIENLQRADITPVEEGKAYAQLELLGVNAKHIAKRTGRSRETVADRIKLTRLPESAQERVESGQLTLETAVYFAQFVDDAELMERLESGDLHNRWQVEFHLSQRKAEAERQARLDAEPPEERAAREAREAAFQQKNAGQRATWEQENEQRRARNAQLDLVAATSGRIVRTWIGDRIASGDTTLVPQLVRMALAIAMDEDAKAPIEILGIESCGEDEDIDDANLRIGKAVDALSAERQTLLLALMVSNALDADRWEFVSRVAALRDYCGYEPSEAELELLDNA